LIAILLEYHRGTITMGRRGELRKFRKSSISPPESAIKLLLLSYCALHLPKCSFAVANILSLVLEDIKYMQDSVVPPTRVQYAIEDCQWW
jgi:hypothetical protein